MRLSDASAATLVQPAWIGSPADRFLRESLQSLRNSLNALGQDLMVLEGSPELVPLDLVSRFAITEVSTSFTPGYYERRTVEHLDRNSVPLQVHRGNSLFLEHELPFPLADLPAFALPAQGGAPSGERAQACPHPLAIRPPTADAIPRPQANAIRPSPARWTWKDLRRLRQFIFDEESITRYKETRNCLDGMDGSSTLSPWLANGCLSVREVARTIFDFERERLPITDLLAVFRAVMA